MAKYTQKWHFLRFFGILFFCRLKISKILVDYAAGTFSAPICDNFGVALLISIKRTLFHTLVADQELLKKFQFIETKAQFTIRDIGWLCDEPVDRWTNGKIEDDVICQ